MIQTNADLGRAGSVLGARSLLVEMIIYRIHINDIQNVLDLFARDVIKGVAFLYGGNIPKHVRIKMPGIRGVDDCLGRITGVLVSLCG